MNNKKQFYIFFVMFVAFAGSSKQALAADFNPNFIISDEELQDYRCMNLPDINSFLTNKGGYISNLTTEDANGSQKRTSEIIYNASQQYRINPKYLLVKLQKEQSLITDKNPSQGQLDWATGYSVCDGCSTSEPSIQKNKGFGKQVDSAAGIMRWYYDNLSSQTWIKRKDITYSIDNTPVTPASLATALLYTYTPHIQGNQNFWILWQSWFDQVYPDGTLLKAEDSTIVYLLQAGKKRAFKSMSVLSSRYDPKYIVSTAATELDRYPEGAPIAFANYSILKFNGIYYLLEDDTIRPFSTTDVTKKFGYNPDEIIEVAQADINGYTMGSPIDDEDQNITGKLIKLDINSAVYYIKGKNYYSVADPQIVALRFPKLKIVKGAIDDIQSLSNSGMMLFPDGTLVGTKINNKVFVIEKNKLRHIASEEVFTGLGYDWKNIVWIDDVAAGQYQNGEPIYLRKLQDTISSTTKSADTLAKAKSIAQPQTADLDTFTPMVFPETGKMVTTPGDSVTYTGDARFQTKIDAYLVASYDDNENTQILAGKNIDISRPIASFTKTMTAFMLFDQGIDLNKATAYDPKVHEAPSGSLFKIAAGDQVKNSNLMDALLVSSFNRPAKMLISSVGDSEKNFVAKMNAQAKDWGLTKTYFTDSHGYDLGNQSTANEYLTIFTKALHNTNVKEYLGTKNYTYDEVVSRDSRVSHSDTHTNKIALKTGLSYNIIASKTGYLNEAGYGIAMLAERQTDAKKFIIISMGNPDYNNKFSEVEKLAQWTMNNF